MDAPVSISARGDPATGSAAGLKLVFKGSGVKLKHLLHSGRKEEQQQHATEWRRDLGRDQQGAASPSQEGAALSDSPGHPFSPSSAEPSPKAAAAAAAAMGPRSVHAQPPGKQPYPDDRTPEAEAARAQKPPQQAGVAADAGAGVAGGVPQPSAAAAPPAGPRSLHSQPPGKQPHPDDPDFLAAAGHLPRQHLEEEEQQQQQQAGNSGGQAGAAAAAGPRSVHGQPPGKNPDQIHQIAASAQVKAEDEQEQEHSAAAEGQALWRWQHQQHLHLPSPAAPPHSRPQHATGAATHAYTPAPAGSSHQAQQRPAPPAPSSRKRPASQSAAEGGQRKKAANGATGQGGSAAARHYSAGVPASLARGGEAATQQQIRPIPGAPRSLQHRQQLVNGATGGGAGRQQPAGRSKQQQPAGGVARPRQQAKPPSSGGQRRPSSAAGGGQGAAAAAGGAAEHQYRPGDVVWAKIGVYPWWPAQLQRPTAEEHFKPKHSAKDIFCVFYGSSDYNYLPPTSLKPFTEHHPDYLKHASIKNKALQRAIDEAWVYGLQRQRPDVNW